MLLHKCLSFLPAMYLPLKEYTGLMRKIPVSCSRFSKQAVSCSASLSRSPAYLSILSPQRWARLFCKASILSRVENTLSSRLPPCFKLCSVKSALNHKSKMRDFLDILIFNVYYIYDKTAPPPPPKKKKKKKKKEKRKKAIQRKY